MSILDASQTDASQADAGPPDPPPPRQVADRLVFATNNGQITALFRADDEGPGSCLIEWIAGCELQDCDYSATSGPFPHAGEITIESPAGTAVLVPNPDTGQYTASAAASWSPGDAVTITAAGADVQAFAVELRGPDALIPIEPDFSTTVAVDRTAPLEFRWEGGSEMANPGLRCNAAGGRVVQARCPVPAETGEGAVPVEVLERLPTCASGLLFLLSEHRVELEPGGLLVRVGARGSLAATSAEL